MAAKVQMHRQVQITGVTVCRLQCGLAGSPHTHSKLFMDRKWHSPVVKVETLIEGIPKVVERK